MRVAGDYADNSRLCRVYGKIFKRMHKVEEPVPKLNRLGRWKVWEGHRGVNVPSNCGHGCNLSQFVQNFGISHISGMKNVIDSCERLNCLRPE